MRRHSRRSPKFAYDVLTAMGHTPPYPRGKVNGRPQCKVCSGPVPKGRRSFCRDKCSTVGCALWDMTVRDGVNVRDKGVCSVCNRNTEEEMKYHALCGDVPAFVVNNREPKSVLRHRRPLAELEEYWLRDDASVEGAKAFKEAWLKENEFSIEYKYVCDWRRRHGLAVEYLLEQLGANRRRYDLWDMNHIIGVELYTGDREMLNDLDNLETLCICCHRQVTAKQTKERAKRKKRNKKMGPKERAMREQRENQ